jgi:hypothetical protein
MEFTNTNSKMYVEDSKANPFIPEVMKTLCIKLATDTVFTRH